MDDILRPQMIRFERMSKNWGFMFEYESDSCQKTKRLISIIDRRVRVSIARERRVSF